MSPELSATSPESRTCQKLYPWRRGKIIFLRKCILGDKGDKSDSKKYLGALDEGVMPDLLSDVVVKLNIS